MELTAKQQGYVIQALAESSRRMKSNADLIGARKLRITLQRAMMVKHLDLFFEAFDEEQLFLIAQALEETAELRQIFASRFDAEMMRETAIVVRAAKEQREAEWIHSRFQEGIAFEAAI